MYYMQLATMYMVSMYMLCWYTCKHTSTCDVICESVHVHSGFAIAEKPLAGETCVYQGTGLKCFSLVSTHSTGSTLTASYSLLSGEVFSRNSAISRSYGVEKL